MVWFSGASWCLWMEIALRLGFPGRFLSLAGFGLEITEESSLSAKKMSVCPTSVY